MTTYPVAPNPIFLSVQGEGALIGTPMIFVRLAGCSVGCALCDTDYRRAERATLASIKDRVAALIRPAVRWAWITGGEPTDHDLIPMAGMLRSLNLSVAVATAGHKPIPIYCGWPVDWVSVSPHDPEAWTVVAGDELKLVPGLNGFGLAPFVEKVRSGDTAFDHYFVSPCHGRPETLDECIELVNTDPRWKLTAQAQRQWGVA